MKKIVLSLLLFLIILSQPILAKDYTVSLKDGDLSLNIGETRSYSDFFSLSGVTLTSKISAEIMNSLDGYVLLDNNNQTLTAIKPGRTRVQFYFEFKVNSTGESSFQYAQPYIDIIDPNAVEEPEEVETPNESEDNASTNYTANDFTITPNTLNVIYKRFAGDSGPVNYVEVNLPKGYSYTQPIWTSKNEEVAKINAVKYESDNRNIIYVQSDNIGETTLIGNYNGIILEIPVKVSLATSPYTEMTKEKIKSLYKKYISPYSVSINNPLVLTQQEKFLNENSNITDYGRQVSLDYLNFFREVSGVKPAKWNNTYIHYAQAGVDFLAENNLYISHTAADNSGNADAIKGLNGSNLHSGSSPIGSLLGYFNDENNLAGLNIGHRYWMIYPRNLEMGIASSRNSSALYISDRSGSEELFTAYPYPGISPIELITTGTQSTPLWNVTFGEAYAAPTDFSKLKVSIADSTGKILNLSYSSSQPTSHGNNFWKGSYDTVVIDPTGLIGSNYNQALNKTYTITISGLSGAAKELSYKTTICSLKDILDISNTPPNIERDKEVGAIYRLYNPVTGEHLYTPDYNEVEILSQQRGWIYEGKAWRTSIVTGARVYRLYSPVTGAHLYTKDKNEVDTLANTGVWQVDNNGNPLFYSDESGNVPVYRLYNPNIRMHLLTTDLNEYNILGTQGWIQEGEALRGN